VTTEQSWTMSSRNLAYPDPNRLNAPLVGFTMSQPIYMGVKSNLDCNTFYLGHIAEVALFRDDLDATQVDCLNRDVVDAGVVSVCQTPDEMPSRAFTRDFLNADRTELSGVELGGTASVDSERGLVLNGVGDYATIRSYRPYGAGAFTVSFWATRTDCAGLAKFEQLYSHVQDPSKPTMMGTILPNANINLGVSCAQAGVSQSSLGTASNAGQVLRTSVQDNAGTFVSFDVSMTEDWGTGRAPDGTVFDRQIETGRTGGTVAGTWVHFALIVDGEKMSVALNGFRQGQTPLGIQFGQAPRLGVATSDQIPNNALWQNGAPRFPMDAPYDWTINPLPTAFTGFDFGDSPAMLGATPAAPAGMPVGTPMAGFFNGGMAGVAIYRQAVDMNGLRCLYSWGEGALAVDAIDT
jgi:hypothetical protein